MYFFSFYATTQRSLAPSLNKLLMMRSKKNKEESKYFRIFAALMVSYTFSYN